jgi:hypothetical protein
MFSFIHKLLNPHCEHCAAERKERLEFERLKHLEERNEIKDDSICESCETLKRQLEIRNHEYELLLNRVLEKPAQVVEDKTPMELSRPRHIPWRVRQQELEAADRQRAELLKKAPQPIVEPPTTEDLEKEVVGGQNV